MSGINLKSAYQPFLAFLTGALALVFIFLLWHFFLWRLIDFFMQPEVNLFTAGITSFIDELVKFSFLLLAIPFFRLRILDIPFMGAGFGLAEGVSTVINTNANNWVILLVWMHIILAFVMTLFFYLALKACGFKKYLHYGLALAVPSILHFSYYFVLLHLVLRQI